jgi:hypothetical protein
MVEETGSATRLLAAHPGLREHMQRSRLFAALAARKRLDIEGEEHYVVRGDTLGGLDDLYLDTLVRGAADPRDSEAHALFQELSSDLKTIIEQRLHR